LHQAALSGKNLDVPSHRADRHGRPSRVDSREITELRQLRTTQPDLAVAVDMQIELIAAQHRVQARVPLPAAIFDAAALSWPQPDMRPLLRFEDVPLDWTNLRLMLRQTADILRRFDTLGEDEHSRIQSLAHEGHGIELLVARWYNATAAPDRVAAAGAGESNEGMLDQVLLLAMRPFLARCAEALLPRMNLSAWTRADCPLCGGEPEFAFINPAAERLLICGRCTGSWHYDSLACPFCENRDPARITSFTSRDGRYRIYACDACQRYVKAYDGRRSDRPVMLAVDSVATLPLDAAAMQRGYRA
jgi:hypothetical protein